MDFAGLETAAPRIAAVGRRLLYRDNQAEVAFLATVTASGSPALAPICPIFSGSGLFVLAAAATPKVRHLRSDARYVLHAQVGADDLEFQVRGRAREVLAPAARNAVIEAIPFPDFDAADPIFEFDIEAAMTVTWENGQRTVTRWPVP